MDLVRNSSDLFYFLLDTAKELKEGVIPRAEGKVILDITSLAFKAMEFNRTEQQRRLSLSAEILPELDPPPIQWFKGRCVRFVILDQGRLRSYWEYLYPPELVSLIQEEADRLGCPLNKHEMPSLIHSGDIFSGKSFLNQVPKSRVNHLHQIPSGEAGLRIFRFEEVLPRIKLGVRDTDAQFGWSPSTLSNQPSFVQSNISINREGETWDTLVEYANELEVIDNLKRRRRDR